MNTSARKVELHGGFTVAAAFPSADLHKASPLQQDISTWESYDATSRLLSSLVQPMELASR